jgi:hypothetical protein
MGTGIALPVVLNIRANNKNMNNTQLLNSAIEQVNQSRQSVIDSQARGIIGAVDGQRKHIKGFKAEIERLQSEAGKLAVNVLTYQDFTGSPLPTAPNANQATIIRVLGQINEGNQASVSNMAQSYVNAIAAQNKNIESAEKYIADQIKALALLSADVVDAETILG